MKNLLLLSISCFLTFTSIAQGPTLTYSNPGFAPGDSLILLKADFGSITVGTTGAGQTWDFSGLTNFTTGISFAYVDPATTPYASFFPNATVAVNTGTEYRYYIINANEASWIGSANATQHTILTDNQTTGQYPISFGYSFTDNYAGTTTLVSTGNQTPVSGTSITDADGWGTLILPFSTHTNVIRMNLHGVYQWCDGIHKGPILQVQMNGTNINRVYCLKSLVTGIDHEQSIKNEIMIFPNPTSDYVTINTTLNSTADIINSQGQVVKNMLLSNTKNTVDLKELANGVYAIRINTGNEILIKKLIKQ